MKNIIGATLLAMTLSHPLHAGVTLDAPGHATAEESAVTASGGEPGAAWALVDWRGRKTGLSGVFDEHGSAVIPPLPAGYYRMVDGENGLATLAVVQPQERLAEHFAVDTALSWISRPGAFLCPWNGGDTLKTVADLVRLAGFAHVRERLRWNEVQPSRDTSPDFSRYIANADLFRERGAAVSGMFHDAPSWAGTASPSESLPADLDAVYDFCRAAAGAFGDRMEDWEFWNEQDIHFAKEPVWEYVAAMKAAYLGFKAANPNIPFLCGALCQIPGPYQAAFLDNDAARYFDVFNYHTYLPISKYPQTFAAIREDLRRAGAEGRPIWVTEFGTNLEGHSHREGAMKGKMAHSPEQELVHAEFYPKAQIALLAEGVERGYFFVFAAFNERGGRKDWGVLRRDGTVKPVFAAMAAMNRELGAARLLGPLDAPAGIRAWLFEQPDGSQTVAYWAESPVDTAKGGLVTPEPDFAGTWVLHPSTPADGSSFRLVDMCGMTATTAPDPDGSLTLHATRYPAYISGLAGLLASPPESVEATLSDVEASKSLQATPPSPIVIRAVADGTDFALGGRKALAAMKGGSGRVKVQVWNFGDDAVTGVVKAAGIPLAGLPAEQFALPPRGHGPVEFDCTMSEPEPPDTQTTATLVLSGVFGGRPTSRLAMPVLFERRFLSSVVLTPLDCAALERWERNDSASSFNVSIDGEEGGAIRFDAAWDDDFTDRWIYPIHALDLPEESLEGAVGVAFEIKTAQDKVENDFKSQHVMLVFDDDRPDLHLPFEAPTGAWERRYVRLPAGIRPEAVTAVRIGANPRGMRCSIWLRDVQVMRQRATQP